MIFVLPVTPRVSARFSCVIPFSRRRLFINAPIFFWSIAGGFLLSHTVYQCSDIPHRYGRNLAKTVLNCYDRTTLSAKKHDTK